MGHLVEEVLTPFSERFNCIKDLTLFFYGLPSPYWGQEQVVTGLLTGQDLIVGLRGMPLGEELLLPSVMLREGEQVFLDDMTLQDLGKALAVPIRVVHGAADVVAGAIGDVGEVS